MEKKGGGHRGGILELLEKGRPSKNGMTVGIIPHEGTQGNIPIIHWCRSVGGRGPNESPHGGRLIGERPEGGRRLERGKIKVEKKGWHLDQTVAGERIKPRRELG